jgi:hypothetical protein
MKILARSYGWRHLMRALGYAIPDATPAGPPRPEPLHDGAALYSRHAAAAQDLGDGALDWIRAVARKHPASNAADVARFVEARLTAERAAPALPLCADELTLAAGETVPLPAELLAAVQDACQAALITADPELERARTAFVRRFIAALFERQLLLVERGRPGQHATVGVDAYSLVCSQKHEAQRRLARVGHLAFAPGEGGQDLAEQLESLFAELTGHAPPDTGERTRARCADAVARVRGIVGAVLGDEIKAPASEQAIEAGGAR